MALLTPFLLMSLVGGSAGTAGEPVLSRALAVILHQLPLLHELLGVPTKGLLHEAVRTALHGLPNRQGLAPEEAQVDGTLVRPGLASVNLPKASGLAVEVDLPGARGLAKA